MRSFVLLLVILCPVLAQQGDNSQTCGTTGKRCIQGRSSCIDGQCQCTGRHTKGIPNFQCYKKNRVAAELKNDPKLTNFNNETIKFPYPCRYLITHVKQDLVDENKDKIGMCEFKVHGFNAKRKGKFYVYGFDVCMKINYDNGSTVALSGRNWGNYSNGVPNVEVAGTKGVFDCDGPYGTDDIEYRDEPRNIRVENFKDPANDQIVLEFRACGLIITFRPYDVELRSNQDIIPGLAVEVNCANHPVWLSLDRVVATAPSFQGGIRFDDPNYLLPGLASSVRTNLVRAYIGAVAQTQPCPAGECSAGTGIFEGCDASEIGIALDSCMWMLCEPRFIKCYDESKSGNEILDLFHKCVEGWCADTGSCSEAITDITTAGCQDVGSISKLPDFLAGALCP